MLSTEDGNKKSKLKRDSMSLFKTVSGAIRKMTEQVNEEPESDRAPESGTAAPGVVALRSDSSVMVDVVAVQGSQVQAPTPTWSPTGRTLQPPGNNPTTRSFFWKKPKESDKVEPKIEYNRDAFGLKILYPNDTAEADIVAVHGLNGHREKSFTAKNGICWLNSLLPILTPNIRVFSYGYDARTHSSSRLTCEHLHGHAEQLLEALTRERLITETIRRPIIFIGHSLGGIVIKSALVLSDSFNTSHLEDQKSIKLSTYGILFMGTPHQGANGVTLGRLAVNIASIVKNTNPEYLANLEKNSEWLEQLQVQYNSISSKFDTKYFYETFPTLLPGGRSLYVVPKHSACVPGAIDAASIAIFDDHTNMVRYENEESDGFKKVGGVLFIMLQRAIPKIDESWQEWDSIKAIGQAQKISYDIPMKLPFQKNHNFTGRRNELSAIHEVLQGANLEDPSHMIVVVLHGLGGMGKTQLANQYAYLYEKDYTSIWWVNARTTGTLSQGFFEIAQELITHHGRIRVHTGQKPDYPWIATALGLPLDSVSPKGQLTVSEGSMKVVIDAVKSWLAAAENHKWLLIIDNYDDLENVDTRDFLPTNSLGRVIITTRARDTRRLGYGIEVAEVGQEDAVEILRRSAHTEMADLDRERGHAITIVEKVGALPLALDQAGAYISALQISYAEYITRLDAQFAEMAARRPAKAVWGYREDTVFTTWEISFKALGSAAQELLMLCAFLDNEDIWEGLFPKENLREKFGIDSLDSAIIDIFALSLAKRKNMRGSFWIHPMVHKWSHERLDMGKRGDKASSAVSLTSAALLFDDREKLDNLTLERRLMPHVQICFNHIYHNHYLGPFTTNLDQLQEVETLQIVLRYHWQLAEAEGLTQWVLVGEENALGKDHPFTLATVNNMALVFDNQTKYDEALEWYGRALTGKQEILGKDHPDTLTTINNMALVFNNQGKYDDALEWHRRALAGREKVLGKDHPDTLATVKNIAAVFSSQGKHDNAIELFGRALAGIEKAFGEDHPDTLTTVNNMASVFENQGKYDDAIKLFERALARKEKALGKGHPFTLTTVNNIAAVLYKQGKYDDALEWYGRALSGKEKALGKDHSDTLTIVNNMASVFNSQGKYDSALEWYKRALSGKEKVLGKNHPDTLVSVNGIASVFGKKCDYSNALEWHRRALAAKEETLGKDHPSTLNTVNNMALVFDGQGEYDDALEWYQRALTGFEKALGKNNSSTLTAINNMAGVLHRQEQYDDAIEWFGRALTGREKTLGKDHPDTLTTVNNMATVFHSQGRYDDAIEWFERALTGREKALDEDHPLTLATISNMALVFEDQGKYDDALEWYGRALAGFEQSLGKDHPTTLTTVNNIAAIFDGQEMYDDAIELFRRALTGFEKTLGNLDHPDILTTINNMASAFEKQGKYDDALEWYGRALAGYEKVLGKDHFSTLTAFINMASVFNCQEKYDDAIEWFERALAGFENSESLGRFHPSALTTVYKIALVFDKQGKYDDASEWFRRALTRFEEALGKDHPSTLIILSNVASVFNNQGKYDDALEWYGWALARKEKALGKDHPSMLATRDCIMGVKSRLSLSSRKPDTILMCMEETVEKSCSGQVPTDLAKLHNT